MSDLSDGVQLLRCYRLDVRESHALYPPPQAQISELQQLVATKDAEIECLQTQLLARGGSANDNAERGTPHSLYIHICPCRCVPERDTCRNF